MGSLHPISEDDDDDDDDNWGERRKVLFTDYLVLGLEYPERVSIDMLSWTWYSKYSAARGLIKDATTGFPWHSDNDDLRFHIEFLGPSSQYNPFSSPSPKPGGKNPPMSPEVDALNPLHSGSDIDGQSQVVNTDTLSIFV